MKNRIVRVSFLTVLLGAFVAASSATAQGGSRAPETFMDPGGFFGVAWEYAVGGADVVAYFNLEENAAPIAGADEFVAAYKGVDWRFSTAENLGLFEADPAAYAPQYGGYCAWAVAEGKRAKGDPRYWHIREGKLYLNVSTRIKRKWLADIPGYIARANENWPGMLDR